MWYSVGRLVKLLLPLTAVAVTFLLSSLPATAADKDYLLQEIQRSNPGAICWESANPVGIFAICIHGAGLNAQTFNGLASQLSVQGIDGVAVNWCANSPSSQFPFETQVISKTVATVRAAYPHYKIWLVGESLGAVAALKVASQPGAGVDGVVCSNVAIRLARQRLVVSEALLETAIPFRKGIPSTARGLVAKALGSRERTALRKKLECCSQQLRLRNGLSILRYMSGGRRLEPESRRVPTLVVQGLRDKLVSKVASAKLVRELDQDRLKFLIDVDSGHLILQENRAGTATTTLVTQWILSEHETPSRVFQVVSDHPISRSAQNEIAKLRRCAGMEDSETRAADLNDRPNTVAGRQLQ